MTATKPTGSQRRIDQLKAIAIERGFTNEDAKPFGKLSKTSTWEALLKLHAVETADSADTVDWTNDGSFPVCGFTKQNPPINFLDWVDFSQLVAFAIASAGAFVLAISLWPQLGPLNLFPPVRINIQIGAKL
ncbi:hypothetical protein QUB05_05675 [Microcoleus sp. F10-C6]|uniref:hypothetical protein n=1 Tax=unclassified Microcoleus TaxID=2642155 RepID=UPI002FD4D71C